MDFTDDVKNTIADGGRIDMNRLQWTREPKDYVVSGDTLIITTAPHTDLWQRTYYHFQNDNAPVLQMRTREKFFSFIVKTDFTQSHQRFDQCGIVMYLDSDNWLKASVEYENNEFQHLGSVVTNRGYSDWATTVIPADVKTMWYRFSRREDDYCIECSTDGETFSQMRICHIYEGADEICFGIYACSPEESSFKAVFTDMKITECAWKAHDGQQPDNWDNNRHADLQQSEEQRMEEIGIEEPRPVFEGIYLDENNSPNLLIKRKDTAGTYQLEIGIFRLTTLSDAVGKVDSDMLEFTATDAAGSPIGGNITLRGDTATVTFTHSTWALIETGAQFQYVRQKVL